MFAPAAGMMPIAVPIKLERTILPIEPKNSFRGGTKFFSYYEVFGGSGGEEKSWGNYYLWNLSEAYKNMGIRGFNLSKFVGYHLVR